MAYKNIQDQRKKDRERYSYDIKNNPKKIQESRRMKRIRRQGQIHNSIRQICSIKGCKVLGERHHPDYDEPRKIIWLCRKHHKLIHVPIKLCKVWGCKNRYQAIGYCHTHYCSYRRGALGNARLYKARKNKAIRLYKSGMVVWKIAQQVGLNRMIVHKYAKQAGLSRRKNIGEILKK